MWRLDSDSLSIWEASWGWITTIKYARRINLLGRGWKGKKS